MRNVFVAEAIKLSRGWVWPLVFLAPFGVISLTSLHIGLLYQRLMSAHALTWPWLVSTVNSLLIPALVLGIAILASMISGMEHRGRMWKQLRALPINGGSYYAGKFLWLMVLLAVSSVLCLIGTLGIGLVLGLGSVPYAQVMTVGVYPYLAGYALVAIQLLLSTTLVNQGYSILAGVIAVIASFATGLLPTWLPWVYPTLAASESAGQGVRYVLTGMVVGAVVFCIGASLFGRKEHH